MRKPLTVKLRWIIAIVAGLVLLVAGVFVYQQATSIVTVINSSGQTVNQVTISVNGASYPLGNLGSGQSAGAAVHPRGDTSVSLSYISAQGVQKQWKGGYIEGSRYRMTLIVGPDGSVKDKTRLKP